MIVKRQWGWLPSTGCLDYSVCAELFHFHEFRKTAGLWSHWTFFDHLKQVHFNIYGLLFLTALFPSLEDHRWIWPSWFTAHISSWPIFVLPLPLSLMVAATWPGDAGGSGFQSPKSTFRVTNCPRTKELPRPWHFNAKIRKSPRKTRMVGPHTFILVRGSLRIPNSGAPVTRHWVGDLALLWASLVAQMEKNPPAMWETWIWSLGWEDLLEEGMATHSSILSWRIPWTEEPGRLQSMGSQRVRHNWATKPCIVALELNFPFIWG